MTITHEHVQHLARRNDSLADKVAKLRARGAKLTGTVVRTLEISAGAALGGLVQGMSKDPNGAHIAHIPLDLGIGAALKLAEVLDLAGDEYSHHLGNLGDGFFGAYFSDLGHGIGVNKLRTGTFFPAKTASASLPAAAAATAVHGAVSPQQMAESLLHQMQHGG